MTIQFNEENGGKVLVIHVIGKQLVGQRIARPRSIKMRIQCCDGKYISKATTIPPLAEPAA